MGWLLPVARRPPAEVREPRVEGGMRKSRISRRGRRKQVLQKVLALALVLVLVM